MKANHWRNQIQLGDALALAQEMPDQAVHCIITSPPYWGLRNYGVGYVSWPAVYFVPVAGLPELEIPAQTCALGMEADPWAYVGHLVLIFRELRRVLRKDGTLWLVLGDSYAGSWGNYAPGGIKGKQRHQTDSGKRWDRRAYQDTKILPPTAGCPMLKPKDMVGIPWRIAFALQADGWYLRSDVIWNKSNTMPESVRDRPTKSHEHVFMSSQSKRYFYDKEAISEDTTDKEYRTKGKVRSSRYSIPNMLDGEYRKGGSLHLQKGGRLKRNRRSVWSIPTIPYAGPHFATYPPKLIEPCLLSSTSAKGVCPECGAQWRRAMEIKSYKAEGRELRPNVVSGQGSAQQSGNYWRPPDKKDLGWEPTCQCGRADVIPAVVLDPFLGTGTTAQVAIQHRRDWAGFELSEEYISLARERLASLQVKLF